MTEKKDEFQTKYSVIRAGSKKPKKTSSPSNSDPLDRLRDILDEEGWDDESTVSVYIDNGPKSRREKAESKPPPSNFKKTLAAVLVVLVSLVELARELGFLADK